MADESGRNFVHDFCDMMSDKVSSNKSDSAKFSDVSKVASSQKLRETSSLNQLEKVDDEDFPDKNHKLKFDDECRNICVNPALVTSDISENNILTAKSEDSSPNAGLQHILDPNISRTLQDGSNRVGNDNLSSNKTESLSEVHSLLLETKDTSCSESVISESSNIALDGSNFSDQSSSQKFSETSSQNLLENNSDPDFTNMILSENVDDDSTEICVNTSSEFVYSSNCACSSAGMSQSNNSGQQSNNTRVSENILDISNLQTENIQGVVTKEINTMESQGFDYEIPVDKLDISENVNNLTTKTDECESPKEQDTVESQGFDYEIPVDKFDISENVNNLTTKTDECESPKEQDTVESHGFDHEISFDGPDVAVCSDNHDEHFQFLENAYDNKATTAGRSEDGDQRNLSIVGKVPSVKMALQHPDSDSESSSDSNDSSHRILKDQGILKATSDNGVQIKDKGDSISDTMKEYMGVLEDIATKMRQESSDILTAQSNNIGSNEKSLSEIDMATVDYSTAQLKNVGLNQESVLEAGISVICRKKSNHSSSTPDEENMSEENDCNEFSNNFSIVYKEENNTFACSCGYAESEILFKNHLVTKHLICKPFRCAYCKSCFVSKQFMKIHIKKKHTKEKRVQEWSLIGLKRAQTICNLTKQNGFYEHSKKKNVANMEAARYKKMENEGSHVSQYKQTTMSSGYKQQAVNDTANMTNSRKNYLSDSELPKLNYVAKSTFTNILPESPTTVKASSCKPANLLIPLRDIAVQRETSKSDPVLNGHYSTFRKILPAKNKLDPSCPTSAVVVLLSPTQPNLVIPSNRISITTPATSASLVCSHSGSIPTNASLNGAVLQQANIVFCNSNQYVITSENGNNSFNQSSEINSIALNNETNIYTTGSQQKLVCIQPNESQKVSSSLDTLTAFYHENVASPLVPVGQQTLHAKQLSSGYVTVPSVLPATYQRETVSKAQHHQSSTEQYNSMSMQQQHSNNANTLVTNSSVLQVTEHQSAKSRKLVSDVINKQSESETSHASHQLVHNHPFKSLDQSNNSGIKHPVHTISPVSWNSKVTTIDQMLFQLRTSLSTTDATRRISEVEKFIKIMAMHFDIKNGTYRCLECKMDWKERQPFWLHFWGHIHIDHEPCKNCSGFENSMPDCSDTEMLLYHFEKLKETERVQNSSSASINVCSVKKDDLVNLPLGKSSSSKDIVICIDFDDEVPSDGKGDCVVHVESSDTTTKSSELPRLSVAYEKVQKFIASNRVLETPPNVDPVEFAKKKLDMKNEIRSLLKKLRDEAKNKVQPTVEELAEAKLQTKLEIIRELFEKITPSASKNNMICQSSALIPTSDVEENQVPIVLQYEEACSEDLHTSSNLLQHEEARSEDLHTSSNVLQHEAHGSKDYNTDADTLKATNLIRCQIQKPTNKNDLEWKSPLFFTCSNCRFSTLFLTEFKKHLWNKHFNESQMCLLCGYTTKEIDLFTKHFQRHATTIKPTTSTFECVETKCLFKCNTLRVFLLHLNCHPKYEMKCHFCKSSFLSLEELQSHLEFSLLTIVTCPHCRAKAMDKKSVIEHISKYHPDKGRMITITKQLICKDRKANNFKTENIATIQQEWMDNVDESDVQFIKSTVPETDSTGIQENEVKTKSSGTTTNHNKRPESALLTFDQEFHGTSEKVTQNDLPQMQSGTDLASEDLKFHETVANKISELDVTISSKHLSNVNTSYDVSDCVEINLNQESFEAAGNDKRTLMTSKDTRFVDKFGFLCTQCSFVADRTITLHNHLSKHMNEGEIGDQKDFSCVFCPSTFNELTDLENHLQYHDEKISLTLFECKLDGYKTNLSQKLENHLTDGLHGQSSSIKDLIIKETRMMETNVIKCMACPYKCITKTEIKQHQRKHTPNRDHMIELSIDQSNLVKSPKKLQFHKVFATSDKTMDISDLFDEHFSNLYNLQNHLFACKICTKPFKYKRSLYIHLCKHLSIPFRCEICDFENILYTFITSHIKSIHNFQFVGIEFSEGLQDEINNLLSSVISVEVEKPHNFPTDMLKKCRRITIQGAKGLKTIIVSKKKDSLIAQHLSGSTENMLEIKEQHEDHLHVQEAKFDNAVKNHEDSCSLDLAPINNPHDSKKKRHASYDSNNKPNFIKRLKLDKKKRHFSCEDGKPSQGPYDDFSLTNSFDVAHIPAKKAGKNFGHTKGVVMSSTSPSKLMQPSTSSSCVVDINNIKQSPKCKLPKPMNLSSSKAISKAKVKFNYSKSKKVSSSICFTKNVSTNSSRTTTMTFLNSSSVTKGVSSNAASRINHKDNAFKTSVYQCLWCNFESVFDKKCMEDHLKTHKVDHIYECNKCTVKFHSLEQIQSHINFLHRNDNFDDDNDVRVLPLKNIPLIALFKVIDVEDLETETASPIPPEDHGSTSIYQIIKLSDVGSSSDFPGSVSKPGHTSSSSLTPPPSASTEIYKYNCPFCQYSIRKLYVFCRHLAKHKRFAKVNTKWKCSVCKLVIPKKSNFRQHTCVSRIEDGGSESSGSLREPQVVRYINLKPLLMLRNIIDVCVGDVTS